MLRRLLLSVAIGTTFIGCGTAAAVATTPASDWKIAGPFGGSAKSVALDPQNPNIVLAGAMNSLLFRSEDGGESWELLNFPKRNLSEVTCVLVDPSDPKHYMAGIISADGGGLFDSRDAGKTWTGVKGVQDFGVRSLVAAPSKPTRFISGTMHGVMLSEDSGKTWTRISDTQNAEMQGITAVAVDPLNPDIIYAGTSHLPWKTMDGGKTWQSIHSGMIDDSDVFSLYVDPANPSDIFASACSGIYASANRGDLWRKLLGIPNTSRRTHVIRKDPSNPNVIFAGTTTGLFKSFNAGTSWRTLTNTQVNSMVFDPTHAGGIYMALEYEGMGKSRDSGDSVGMINRGFVDRSISSVTRAGTKLLAIEPQLGETTGIFVSVDKGETWTQLSGVKGLGGIHLRSIAGMSSEDRVLLAAGPHQMYKSIDGGVNWKPIPIRLVIGAPPAEVTAAGPKIAAAKPIASKSATRSGAKGKTAARATAKSTKKPAERIREINPSDISAIYTVKSGTQELFFAATNLGLLRSAGAGELWTMSEMPGAAGVSGLFIAPNSDGRLFARGENGLYASTDFGDHWSKFNFPLPSADVNDIGIPVAHNAPLFVATRLGLYTTRDGGVTWFANAGGIPASTVSSVIYGAEEKTAYAVQYGRLYQTKDWGASWVLVPSALPATRIRQLWMPDYTSSRLYGITTDLGVLFRN